jgi:hypothetical protein
MPYATPLQSGHPRDLPPRHQVGSWYPVKVVKVVPSDPVGDIPP